MSIEKRWLVSVAVGGAFDFGPSCVVEAASADDAATKGLAYIKQEDRHYGVTCDHCENDTIRELLVVNLADTLRYAREVAWAAHSQAKAKS